MGNNQSSVPTPSRSARTLSKPPSSAGEGFGSSSAASSSDEHTASTSSASSRRRKKSIDLADIDTSLSFGHGRTKSSARASSIQPDLAALDEGDEVEGTLRGAMQGKAEHVVYGPRRPESEVGATIPSVAGVVTLPSTDAASHARKVGLMRAGAPTAISMPGSSIDAQRPMDPDDTMHPNYAKSARLTSDVLMSSEQMPVIVSPETEEGPESSPFGPEAKDDKIEKQASGSTTATEGSDKPKLGSSSVAAIPHPVPSRLPSSSGPPSHESSGRTTPARPEAMTSLSGAVATLFAPAPVSPGGLGPESLLPPHTSAPFPPRSAPVDTVLAPIVPLDALPLPEASIPSGTGVIVSPADTPHPSAAVTPAASSSSAEGLAPLPGTGPAAPMSPEKAAVTNAAREAHAAQIARDGGSPPQSLTPSVLLPSNLLNAPVAAVPIPLPSVPSPSIARNLMAAAVDVGAGAEGVPTLIKWKDEDGQGSKPPKEVFVTGTFARGWKTKIALRRTRRGSSDFSALIALPPGPHRLKFIVDNEWRASKHLPSATDADGNLINYLNVTGTGGAAAAEWGTARAAAKATTSIEEPTADDEDDEVIDDEEWTQELPQELVEWGEWEAELEQAQNEGGENATPQRKPPFTSTIMPPSLPAQLERGPLNHAAYVTQGSGDDNSILPKPDHSVINHLAASPIKGGFLSVGVTIRYKRKVGAPLFSIAQAWLAH